MVGILRGRVVPSDEGTNLAVVTHEFFAAHQDEVGFLPPSLLVTLRRGAADMASFLVAADDEAGEVGFAPSLTADQVQAVQKTLDTEAGALLTFAAIAAGAAGLVCSPWRCSASSRRRRRPASACEPSGWSAAAHRGPDRLGPSPDRRGHVGGGPRRRRRLVAAAVGVG